MQAMPVILVLASGQGERFRASGGAGSKLQAPLAGMTVLERTLQAVRASGLPWHLEDAGHPGMGDSIAAAVRANDSAPGWLVLPGDLPLVQADSLRRVGAALEGCDVVTPRYQGRRGHPVGFGRSQLQSLLALSGAAGAAAVVKQAAQSGRLRLLDLDDAGIVTDIDTLADLAAAERQLGQISFG